MQLLLDHFRQHPVTGPTERGPATVTPGAPLNLRVVDHITASVQEITDYTHAVTPGAAPLPARVQDVYRWVVANTTTADEAVQQRRDTIVYRQSLEHALAMGDIKVVRPHRCPACHGLGLMWQPSLQRAVCTSRRCLTRDGTSQKWTLARLAYEHVAGQKNHGRVSAT
jgi:hypothetical protein